MATEYFTAEEFEAMDAKREASIEKPTYSDNPPVPEELRWYFEDLVQEILNTYDLPEEEYEEARVAMKWLKALPYPTPG